MTPKQNKLINELYPLSFPEQVDEHGNHILKRGKYEKDCLRQLTEVEDKIVNEILNKLSTP